MSDNSELSEPEILELYNNFITSEDIDELELGLSVPNIFEILKVSNKEIRHSNFLAWLLNPNASHGLGDTFLKRFLRKLFSSDKVNSLDPISVMETDLSKARVKREWKHIDLLIELDCIVVLVENKVYANESKGQLTRYKQRVEKEFPGHEKVYVFLTPNGVEPEGETEWFQDLSYQTIINIIQKILSTYDQNLNPSAKVYIQDYQTILKRELMSGDKLSELAQRIYYNHRELMDFIIENRPDINDEVRDRILTMLNNKGYKTGSINKYYARFYTDSIETFIFHGTEHNGWKHKESFLFEINFKNNKMKVCFAIAPSDRNYDRERLIEVLNKAFGTEKKNDDRWIHYFNSDFKFNTENLYEMDEDEIEEKFEKLYNNHIEPIVNKIEKAFEENSETLLKLKQEAENRTNED